MNCPQCDSSDFYQPLIGKGEFVNAFCVLYSENHAKVTGVLTPSDKRHLRLKTRSEKDTIPITYTVTKQAKDSNSDELYPVGDDGWTL